VSSCDVCGRTILAGEKVHAFVDADGRRSVCELCIPRAERLGWRREEEVEEGERAPAPRRRGLGSLLRRRGRREEEDERPVEPDPEAAAAEPADEPEEPPAAPPQASRDPAAPGRTTGRLAPEVSPLSRFERAAARFNASEAGRTVTGLSKTLGRPWVSIGASAGAAEEVRITVAWELSWYQWGVDLRDELRPVFQIDKGHEIEQLDAAARQWNAVAEEDGRIVLRNPGVPVGGGAPARR
jgi:hypothetical protein